jgi:hypothetical protein
MSIAELQAQYNAAQAELNAAIATQLTIAPGTAEWRAQQQVIGDLRTETNLANQALLTAKIAELSPVYRGGTTDVSLRNELFYVEQELAKAERQARLAAEYAASH